MTAFEIILSVWVILFGITILMFLLITNKPSKPKTKHLKIAKTIIPLEYTGKDYQNWIDYICIQNQINEIRNGGENKTNRLLTERLRAENLFKENHK